MNVHTKFGPDRFSRFDVYWIQKDRQTEGQAKYIYIDSFFTRFFPEKNSNYEI